MRRSNHENIHVFMMIGLVTEGEEEGKSHCKVGTLWVRQTVSLTRTSPRTAKVKITTIRTTDPWLEMPWCQPDHLPRLQINLPRLVGAEHVQGFRDVVLTFFFCKKFKSKMCIYNIL